MVEQMAESDDRKRWERAQRAALSEGLTPVPASGMHAFYVTDPITGGSMRYRNNGENGIELLAINDDYRITETDLDNFKRDNQRLYALLDASGAQVQLVGQSRPIEITDGDFTRASAEMSGR